MPDFFDRLVFEPLVELFKSHAVLGGIVVEDISFVVDDVLLDQREVFCKFVEICLSLQFLLCDPLDRLDS